MIVATLCPSQDLSDIADLSSLSSQLECVAALHNPVNGLGLLSGQAQVIQPAPGSKHSKAAGQVQQSSKEEYRRPSLAADKVGRRLEIKTGAIGHFANIKIVVVFMLRTGLL